MIAASSAVIGQAAAEQLSLETILNGADAERRKYVEKFTNLTSTETKIFEYFDKSGFVKRKRTVESIFIVFQTAAAAAPLEFRNVTAVDGKPVGDEANRTEKFFAAIAESALSAEKALSEALARRIVDESSRYDGDFLLNGLTLYQAPILAPNLRPAFGFSRLGIEIIDGRPTIVVAYEQTRDSADVRIDENARSASGRLTLDYPVQGFSAVKPRLRGKLWLDAASLQLRREERSLTVEVAKVGRRSATFTEEFQYRDSEFGILTPAKITHTQFKFNKKDGTSAADVKVTFEYGKFSEPNVDVKSADVKN